jgi:hypothetical protein
MAPRFDNSLTYIGLLIETEPNSDTFRGPCGMDGRTFTRTTETQDTIFAACEPGKVGNRVRAETVDDWTISGQGTMELAAYDMLDIWKSGPSEMRGPRKVIVRGYTGDSNSATVHVHYVLNAFMTELGLPQGANSELVQTSVTLVAADGGVERVTGPFTGTVLADA